MPGRRDASNLSVASAAPFPQLFPGTFGVEGATSGVRPSGGAGGVEQARVHQIGRTAMSVPASEEEALVAKAATGDTAAFRALYTRHRTDVARLGCRMLGARSDLDDVIQEVFFQVYKSLKDFRGKSKFSTWLHRVTVNVVLMHRRAAKSRPVYTEETAQDITPDDDAVLPDEDADRRERVRAFARVLARLADKKRIVFVLHELEGMPPSEIADVVGAPVLTVRTRLFYARREIEVLLAEEPALANLRASFAKVSAVPRAAEAEPEAAAEPAPQPERGEA